MRPVESLFVLAVFVTIVWLVAAPRSRAQARQAGGVLLVVAAVQVFSEPWRWQLVPIHLVVAWAAIAPWTPVGVYRRARTWLVAVALAALLPILVPVPRLAEPDGEHSVGTFTVVLIDESRDEYYGPDPGEPRRLPVHVWYPADAGDADREPWLDTAVTAVISDEYGLPGFFLDHLSLVATQGAVSAPVAAGSEAFPVVLYSHGWGGMGRISPDQPERLASHGYVVVAADHTYGALVASLPEGPVRIDLRALPEQESVSEAEFDAAGERLVATYAADLEFLVDSLGELDGGVGLTDRMDLERIGVFGHSTGGGAAVAACGVDDRCDAVFGLDPWVEPVDPAVLGRGSEVPFAAMRSQEWLDGPNDEALRAFHRAGDGPSRLSWLKGADHNDFVALAQISPLASVLGFKGPIPGPAAQGIIGGALVAFFDTHLRGLDTELPELGWLTVDAERG